MTRSLDFSNHTLLPEVLSTISMKLSNSDAFQKCRLRLSATYCPAFTCHAVHVAKEVPAVVLAMRWGLTFNVSLLPGHSFMRFFASSNTHGGEQ